MSQLFISRYAAVVALRTARDRCRGFDEIHGWKTAVNLLSYALKAADPAFSQAQFIQDCGWYDSYHWDMDI